MRPARDATVLVVDDHPVFRRGLRVLLESAPWVGRVLEASGVEQAVKVATSEPVDVIAMDLALPDGTGLDATRRALTARPGVAVLVLTMSNERQLVGELLDAGARGYLLKETDPDDVVEALHAVGRGALVLGPDVDFDPTGRRREDAEPSRLDRLTSREAEVLAELAGGLSNARIARRLGLTEKTVRNHLSAVFAKLQVTDRTQAALMARELGL